MISLDSAITVLEDRSRIAIAGNCRVCGDALSQGNVMRCGNCETPHHNECYAYAGGCAMYGCSEMPKEAHRALQHVPARPTASTSIMV